MTYHRPKIGYRRIARNTDARSFMGAAIPSFPCGDSVFILHVEKGTTDRVSNAIALLNSFVFDWSIRQRLAGTNLNWHVLAEGVLPNAQRLRLSTAVHSLNLFPRQFSQILTIRATHAKPALLNGERIRLRSIADALASAAYGCTTEDLHHILRDTDLPTADLLSGSKRAASLDARGFWRVDRDVPPEVRHTVLTLVAFHNLQSEIQAAHGNLDEGIAAFLAQNDGEGWMLPETLCLADYGLGHDHRAKNPQPVASTLGPRFYDWQLVLSTDEADRECHLHARNLLGSRYYSMLLNPNLRRQESACSNAPDTAVSLQRVAEQGLDYRAEPPPVKQGTLFEKGNIRPPQSDSPTSMDSPRGGD